MHTTTIATATTMKIVPPLQNSGSSLIRRTQQRATTPSIAPANGPALDHPTMSAGQRNALRYLPVVLVRGIVSGRGQRERQCHRTIEGWSVATVRDMFSGLMYILRADALEVERGDSPDLSSIYAPGTARQARRRLILVWILSTVWLIGIPVGGLVGVASLVAALLGLVLAVSTQFEAAWIGSPVRPWSLYAIPVSLAGFVVAWFAL